MTKTDVFKSAKAKKNYENHFIQREKQWPVSSRDYFINTSYGETLVREWGEGEPLVLLPGINTNSLHYKDIINNLGRNFRVFALDTIGDTGRSYASEKVKTSADYVLWQDEVYHELGIHDNLSILGTSYGAWLAALYACENPSVHSLILISPAALFTGLKGEFLFKSIMAELFPFTKKNLFKWIFRDHFRTDPYASSQISDFLYDVKIKKKCMKSFQMPAPGIIPEKKLKDLTCSVLYLVGANEVLCDWIKAVETFQKCIKKGTYEVIPEAGHDLLALKPDYVANKTIEFLKK